MTLEKLLIFGFALAALFALSTLSFEMSETASEATALVPIIPIAIAVALIGLIGTLMTNWYLGIKRHAAAEIWLRVQALLSHDNEMEYTEIYREVKKVGPGLRFFSWVITTTVADMVKDGVVEIKDGKYRLAISRVKKTTRKPTAGGD